MFMKLSIILRLFLCSALAARATVLFAFETDQYNLPPKPLADIGGEVSEYTEENLRKALGKINAEIRRRQSCLAKEVAAPSEIKCGAAEKERSRLEFLRTDEAVAQEVFNLLGAGFIPLTKAGSWMEAHRFRAQPARYKTDYDTSIFFAAPTNYITISSTVKLYGAQFGTDKIAHFFQQGYTYYQIYRRAAAKGLSPEKAAEKAVRWGQMTERTYYGTLISGVYSNADLYANYAGMKFYQKLTRPVKIGDATQPAVLRLEDGVWTIAEDADWRENLVKPFFSNHLNEAFNPSIFSNLLGLRSSVRQTIRKQSCKGWLKQFPDLTPADLRETSKNLQLWHGEDYGFTESRYFITIADTCFADKNSVADQSD